MLKVLRERVEAHLRELHEHPGLICYKIDIYEAIAAERELS
jgi:hypothetical protein